MNHTYFLEVALIWSAYFAKKITLAQRDVMLGRYRAGATALDDLA